MSNFSLVNFLFPIQVAKQEDDGLVIRGFASTEHLDSHGDVVMAEGFDVDRFLAEHPIVVVQHDINHVAGKARELFPAVLADVADPELWGVVNLRTGEQADTIPREQVPSMKAGDKGLYVVAIVTDQEVADDVKAGRLRAFSWKGNTLARNIMDAAGRVVQRVLSGIELAELTLTHRPANPFATVVLKSQSETTEMENLLAIINQLQQQLAHTASALETMQGEQEQTLNAARRTEQDASKAIDGNDCFGNLFASPERKQVLRLGN